MLCRQPPAVSLVQTSDALAEQLIEAVATDRAIEDALYQLEKEMQDGSAAAADPIEDSMTLEALIGKEEEKITRETESFSPPSPENAGADDCCSLRTNNLSLTRKHT